ncbi:uncharacterized protein LOC110863459 [Folsomia candida]|uniref:Uncharacterized protein n=1 Tax=Folsomia candida TaxID=158441 RepID=A0A226F0F4_FOLCA|nr:uncharacterized protein LOC110863459 [Folsomia candida]OXA63282.1 hypothetical protein Fcan01_00640 [Folsomia candida]
MDNGEKQDLGANGPLSLQKLPLHQQPLLKKKNSNQKFIVIRGSKCTLRLGSFIICGLFLLLLAILVIGAIEAIIITNFIIPRLRFDVRGTMKGSMNGTMSYLPTALNPDLDVNLEFVF